MKRFILWADRVSPLIYLTLIILSVISLTILAIIVMRNTDDIKAQQEKLEKQIRRTQAALVYTCETTRAVREIDQVLIDLIASVPPTEPRTQALDQLNTYQVLLSNDQACREVAIKNP